FNSAGDTQIIQELLNVIGGTHVNPNSSTYVANCHTTATYWQGSVYFGAVKDAVKQFAFTNGLLSTSPASQSTEVYQFPGSNPAISADVSTNGILWMIENAGPIVGIRTATTAVLHAYNAANLGDELYNSTQASSDSAGAPVKFAKPTVVNGKVYVGTQSSIAVYGLLSSLPQAAAPTFSPGSGSYSGPVSVTISGASSGTTIYYTTDGTTPTTSSNVYSGPVQLSTAATLSAIAVGAGFRTSTVTVGTYVITSGGTPSFAQVASATPQSPTATVNATYPGTQTAGDLNVVAVGWNDTTSTVQSVKDSAGNSYSLAIGPTSGTALRQSIYYAPNIVGGSNTVTVTFSQAAVYPDVRILEYRGVNAVDVTAGASGSSTAANSGSATTTSANELIFGANMVETENAAVGSGFTARIITSPDGDLAEDKVVTTTGSNSATATLTSSGPWVMQMVTFFARSGPAPTVTNVSPNSGTTAGGTAVTISGTNFTAGATVTFGSAAATNVVVVSGTQITATTPVGSAGAATVTVSNPGGQSGSLASAFTYVAAPTVSSVSPNSGSTAGGTAVTITGTNFATGAAVTFGSVAATNVVVTSSTTITATTPAGSAGATTVTVTNPGGLSGSSASAFSYLAPPTVTSVSPSSGSTLGGAAVTITGTNFATGATVTFGSAAATNVVVVSSTTITATTPAGSGTVTVTVTVSGQSGSLTSGFTYVVVPTISSVTPNNGGTAGGTAVTITGTNFATGATVTFGGTAATNVVVVNSTSITATSPAHAVGAVTVTVTVSGQSGNLTNGFTYVAPPTVTSVSPSSGSTLGGTAVTITGTNFAAGATVTFGSAGATNVVVVSSTTITATTPAGSAGAATVTVTNLGALAGSLTNGYTYVVPPTVTGVSPSSGTTAGGTAVTITGTNFATGATVTFGGTAATNVAVVNSTTITATTPAGSGTVTVTVTVSGQSGSLTNGFTYSGNVPTAPGALTPGAGPGPIVDTVQGYYNSTFLTTHTTAAFDSTGGDLIVLFASSHFGVTFSPSDNFGNTWISIAGPTTTALGFDLESQIWYAPNPTVGPGQIVTMNLSQSLPLVMSIIVVKGSNISSPIDAVSLIGSDNGTQSVNVSSPSITTVGMNDLLLGFSKVSAGVTFQPGTGFTQQTVASSNFLDAETGPAPAAGTYASTFTIDSQETWQAAVVAVANNPNQASLSWTASTEVGAAISDYLVERCQGT
ncbi:MAG: IPT/TIG domain-containing protein, partial [Candidatus Sulfotelmatobacter sp.]